MKFLVPNVDAIHREELGSEEEEDAPADPTRQDRARSPSSSGDAACARNSSNPGDAFGRSCRGNPAPACLSLSQQKMLAIVEEVQEILDAFEEDWTLLRVNGD